MDKPTTAAFVLGRTDKVWAWPDVCAAGHFLTRPHPDVIEVSFALTKGMSGAPSTLRGVADERGKPMPYFVLLDICVNNEPSRVVDFSVQEASKEGNEFKESTARVEEYGIVHDLTQLADWVPKIGDGRRLVEPVQPTEIIENDGSD